ncbi:Chloride conductance regulatory protein ICln-like [Zea mays]|uniref:Chloride conductance regulatory protein ICln n=1 Tax=Zea mays TaxID=4577 RepID=C4J968_MAIZE|nr:Chloride conductance regulatory protein ICln-like [Zea mays]ACR37718.1 unknown [Zea mays]ONL95983.1 Chloride conductance regulatory protein ICln [Zea mays]
MAPGLQRFTDIADDGTPQLDAASGEELVRVDRTVAVALGPRSPESPGTLFVTTRRVIWLSEAEKGKGYAVDFLAISLHAVSRDLEAYPSPCIYTQIEAAVGTEEEAGESNPEANELELSRVSEMRLILADPGQLDALFDVFCHCAELNPDPNAECNGENGWIRGEDMSNGDWIRDDVDMVDENVPQFFNANPIGQNGGYDLSRSVFELQINDQRFEDAEEEQESHENNGH